MASLAGWRLFRNTLQVIDERGFFQAGYGAATSCMPSLLARCDRWCSTRSRYRSS